MTWRTNSNAAVSALPLFPPTTRFYLFSSALKCKLQATVSDLVSVVGGIFFNLGKFFHACKYVDAHVHTDLNH